MAEQLKAAIIGCGAIGPIHASSILAAGEELVALCDLLPERAEALKEKLALKDTRIYSDWKKMLDEERIDVLHVCTPHDQHAMMCVEALSRDISVLCEKPLCISLGQLDTILAAEKKSKGQLAVCLQNRYETNSKRLKALVEENGFDGAYASVVWNRGVEYYRSGEWRGTKAHEGGGVAINQAIHTLDLLQWVCGMPKTVIAHAYNDHLKGEIEVEDTVAALFETVDGKKLNFFATTAGAKDFPPEISVRLSTKEIALCQNDLFAVGSSSANATLRQPTLGGKLVWGKGHEALIRDFYDHIRTGSHFPIDGEEGAKSVRMVLGIYRSGGEPVTL